MMRSAHAQPAAAEGATLEHAGGGSNVFVRDSEACPRLPHFASISLI
jgi:hypothetical protein